MKRLILLLAFLLSLTFGCGTMQWCKPGATQDDFKRDSHECEMKSLSINGERDRVDFQLYQECMKKEKGWKSCKGE